MRARERGFSLLEVTIAAGLSALVAAGAYEALAARPAETAATTAAFAGLVARARALAAADAAGPGGGATLAVERDGDLTVVTLYAGRPIPGAPAPRPVSNIAPLRSPTPIALGDGTANGSAFALFFSPAGHVSAAADDRPATDPALAAEPPCALERGIALVFGTPPRTQSRVVSCAYGAFERGADQP